MKCELPPGLLGDLSPTWILQSWSLSRSIGFHFLLLPPAYLHMAFGNLLLLRLPLLCQKWTCHHKCLHHLNKDLPSAIGDQEDAVCLHVPLHTILLRIKLLRPLCSSSSSFHRTSLRSLRFLFSPFLHVGTLTLQYHMHFFFYNVSIRQYIRSRRLQIAFPTVDFSENLYFWLQLISFHSLCGDRKHKDVWSKTLEDVKSTSFCDTEVS